MAEQRDPETDKVKNDAPAYQWHEVWMKVLANPSEATFNDILSVPGVSTKRALRWIFLANLAAVGISIFIFLLRTNEWGIIQFFPQIAVAVILNGIVGVISFVISSLFFQGFARLGGGEGSFEQFHYAYAASSAPMTVIGVLVAVSGASPIFFLAIWLYQIILIGLALRTVNGFTWGRTIVTLMAAFAVISMILIPLVSLLVFLTISGIV